MRRQGFIRARIDGIVCDLDEAPTLNKKQKHTVEVVVDRFKVKGDIALRLAESFETALTLAEGLVVISYMEEEQPDQLFSAKFACPVCNYSLNELEPRLFSFNNPAGACPTCDGLGVHQFFDIDRVIQHPEASIAEGAIRGWDRRTLFYYNMLTSLAEHYAFDIDTSWEKLSPIHQQKILFGSDDEEITFNYVNDRGTVFRREHKFEGVIHNMERRYRETESQSVREELTKFMATSDCPECSGTQATESQHATFSSTTSALKTSCACLWVTVPTTFDQLCTSRDGRVKLPIRLSKKFANDSLFSSMWGLTIYPLTGVQILCPVAKRNEFVWPARSEQDW